MKTFTIAILSTLPILTAQAQIASAPLQPPRLEAVTLSSGGVGQYTFITHLDSAGAVPLTIPLSQVDDLLASLRIDDPAGGAPSLRLPGRQPLAEAFRTLAISEDALTSPDALLQALVGAQIRLPGAAITGAIISVTAEQQRRQDDTILTRHRLAIATPAGLATAILEDQPEIEIVSPQLKAQIAAGLAAIADHRAQDSRTVTITLPGPGARDIHLAYVVPAPVWKASYRLRLPPDGPARLQGYAVVENLSGQDWHGVHVTLTSGQPVLFHQPLYQSLFVDRPEAPVMTSAHLAPDADAGAQPAPVMAPAPPSLPTPAPAPAIPRTMAFAVAKAAPGAVPEPAPEPGATATQEATQVEFHIDAPVDAAAGQSLLLPIIDRALPVRRVALFTPEGDGTHPFVALQLTNDTGSALPPGLATLYGTGGAFVGDTLMPPTQPKDERMLSFANDLATRITTTRTADSGLVSGHAARGMVTLTLKDRNTTTYRVTTSPDEPRHVVIEQPLQDGWTVAQPAGSTRTPTRWRFTQDIPGGATQDIPVILERTRAQLVAIGSLSPSALLEYTTNATLDPAARAAFTTVAALRAELGRRTAALSALHQQVATVITDQDRVRKNLASTTSNQALQKRYTALLQQQEDDLAVLRTKENEAQSSVEAQQRTLDDTISQLSF